MWELTVERNYTSAGTVTNYNTTDRMYFESTDLEELQIIINYFDSIGTGGKFSYKLERKEKEEHEAV